MAASEGDIAGEFAQKRNAVKKQKHHTYDDDNRPKNYQRFSELR